MKIEIWSDIACPYCYIGKRKLENALARFPHRDEIELIWCSYELNPDLPQKPVEESFYDFYSRKFGLSTEQARAELKKMEDLADSEAGLKFDFSKAVAANTFNALRLVKLAAENGLATQAEEILFEAYFCKGLDVSNPETLSNLGVRIGLKKEEIETLLSGNLYADKVRDDIRRGEEELGLYYVPFYYFDRREKIQGAIAAEEYLRVLQQAYDNWKSDATGDGEIITGQSCTLDGICS